MLVINRISPKGISFVLSGDESKTKIEWNGKAMVFNVSIDEMSQGWYNWQMKGLLVQQAFPFLSNEQREFLMTGMTPEEWREVFPGEDED